jgi:hypothetical protein
MTSTFRHSLAGALSLAAVAAATLPAGAIELAGAWATDAGLCDKVFTKKGSQLAFAELSDLYGSGFIIEGKRIRGKAAQCTIKSQKENGAELELQASCATRVMHSDVQFNLKVIDDNSIARSFPGMQGMEVNYHRCAF